MTVRLSYSAVNKYLSCGKEYELHYIQKLRSKFQSSPLIFGSAMDSALEHLVINRDFEAAVKVFNDAWTFQEINKVRKDLRLLTTINYSGKDLDLDLLESEDFVSINEVCGKGASFKIDEVVAKKKANSFKFLKKKEKELFNYTNWLCMKRKGFLLLQEAAKIIDENLVELLGTQVKVELENESGDSSIGYADLVVRWKGFDKPIVMDFKTSSPDYKSDSVRTSPQLSGYVLGLSEQFENTDLGGYIVLNKNIVKNRIKICKSCGYDGSGKTHRKCDKTHTVHKFKDSGDIFTQERCNGEWEETFTRSVKSQVIIDKTTPEFTQQTLDNYDFVCSSIKAEEFPQNWNSCIRYGIMKCDFFELCHNGKMDDLEKKNED